MSTYIAVKDLPAIVQTALNNVGYNRKDIAVEASPTFYFPGAYGDGYRGYTYAFNLATGEYRMIQGSWGGGYAGASPSQIDADSREQVIPFGGGVIMGQEGGGRPTSARLVVHPENVAKLLPAVDTSVTERDRDLLSIFGGIKSGYRKEYLRRAESTDAEIETLIARRFLSKNKAGSISITTAGKNARSNKSA